MGLRPHQFWAAFVLSCGDASTRRASAVSCDIIGGAVRVMKENGCAAARKNWIL